ncbi:hypothetical protein P7C73_g1694, partial [Tremellales sp. Uapishka_1]
MSDTIPQDLSLLQDFLSQSSRPAAIVTGKSPDRSIASTRNGNRILYRNPVLTRRLLEDSLQHAVRQAGPEQEGQAGDWGITWIGSGRYAVFVSTVLEAQPDHHVDDVGCSSRVLLASQSVPLVLPTSLDPSRYLANDIPLYLQSPYPPAPKLPADAVLKFNRMFMERDWSRTKLGPIDTWDPQLRQWVQLIMASPFPVLLPWGTDLLQIYNEPYARNIGKKHPHILGLPYREAWSEIWDDLQPPLERAMRGETFSVQNHELFMYRGDSIEETYFDWSLNPIRDDNGQIVGLWNINFDQTRAIKTGRRIRNLHEIAQVITGAQTYAEVGELAMKGMQRNERDVPFALVWTIDTEAESSGDESIVKRLDLGSNSGSFEAGSAMRRNLSNQGDTAAGSDTDRARRRFPHSGISEPTWSLRLVATSGVDGSLAADSIRVVESDLRKDAQKGSMTVASMINDIHRSGETMFIPNLDDIPELRPMLQLNSFGDRPSSAVLLQLRSSSEDRLHGIIMIGTGFSTIALYFEEIKRVRYLNALNKQKNEELRVMLKQRTDELRASESRFTTSFDDSPAGMFIALPNSKIVSANPAYRGLFGMTPDCPLDTWLDYVHEDDRQAVSGSWREAFLRSTTSEFRVRLKGDEDPASLVDGERWVEGRARLSRDQNGKLQMVSGTVVDISMRLANERFQAKRAEDALAVRKRQEAFVDMTSHELRNPLSAITLAVDDLVDRLRSISRASPEIMAEAFDIMSNTTVISMCTTHMKRLVDDVLSLSKLDSDLLVVYSVPCQPIAFCQEVIDMMRPELARSEIQHDFVVLQGFRDLGVDWVKVDPARTQQILINLFTNAIKFTSKADIKRITLTLDACHGIPLAFSSKPTQSLTASKSYLVFHLMDSGPGIGAEEASRLFQRFSQGTPETHIHFGGSSGLGLFIARRLCQLLGGDIHVVPTSTGQGGHMSFYVEAPVCRAPAILPTIHLPPPSVSEVLNNRIAIKLLVVEDNLINQTLLRKALVKAGYTVVGVANNGVEALQAVAMLCKNGQAGLDCVLMDIEMPIMGGRECAIELRRRGFTMPIIAVSANARSGQIDEMLQSGINSAVAKPFKMAELNEQIHRLVGADTYNQ